MTTYHGPDDLLERLERVANGDAHPMTLASLVRERECPGCYGEGFVPATELQQAQSAKCDYPCDQCSGTDKLPPEVQEINLEQLIKLACIEAAVHG